MPPFTIIIPACNEEGYIGPCLDAVLAQDASAGPLHVIVAANGCTDQTVAQAQSRIDAAGAKGHQLDVLDIAQGSKPGALNAGDAHAGPLDGPRAYLDADILLEPDLIGALRAALDVDAPRYATGALALRPAVSFLTRAYGRFWMSLPFIEGGAVGAGFYAVNAPGRARWSTYPDLIADDSFARLQFAPDERTEVPVRYHWPLVEGLPGLVKVRRRQNKGMHQLAEQMPELMHNEGKAPLTASGLLRRALARPFGFVTYALVAVLVRAGRANTDFTRGR